MKKILIVLLIVTLLMSMAACMPLPRRVRTEPIETTAETTEATEITVETTNPEPMFGHCTPEAGVYSNDFLGFSFTAPEGWGFYNDAQLAEMNGMIGNLIDDEALREQITNSGVIYEMVASEAVTSKSVSLTVQNLGAMAGMIESEEQLADTVIPTLESSLSAAGYELESCRRSSINFLGEERTCIVIQAVYSGVKIIEVQINTIVCDYVGVLTIAVAGQEPGAGLAAIAEICNSFNTYEAQPWAD